MWAASKLYKFYLVVIPVYVGFWFVVTVPTIVPPLLIGTAMTTLGLVDLAVDLRIQH